MMGKVGGKRAEREREREGKKHVGRGTVIKLSMCHPLPLYIFFSSSTTSKCAIHMHTCSNVHTISNDCVRSKRLNQTWNIFSYSDNKRTNYMTHINYGCTSVYMYLYIIYICIYCETYSSPQVSVPFLGKRNGPFCSTPFHYVPLYNRQVASPAKLCAKSTR